MKILVTLAVESEFAPWRRLRTFYPGRLGQRAAYFARAVDAEVAVVLTGMGPDRAARTMLDVLAEEHPDLCISAGLAGALQPQHRPGEILAARGVSSPSDERLVRSTEGLLDLMGTCGARIVRRFHTSPNLILKAEEKARLADRGDAVEMESYEVLTKAVALGLPVVAVRAISDAHDEDLPLDFNRALTANGQVSLAKVLGQVARQPSRIPALLRFGRQSRSASVALAHLLNRCVDTLSGEGLRPAIEHLEEVTAT